MRLLICRASLLIAFVLFVVDASAGTRQLPSANVPSRYMMGSPGRFPLRQLSQQVQHDMRVSMKARREMAWSLVADLLTEKSLERFPEWKLPLWSKQYASDDLQRLVRLSKDRPQVPFSELEEMHERALESNSTWQEHSFFTWLGYFKNLLQVRGSIGLIRTLYDSNSLERVFNDRNHLADCTVDSENSVISQTSSDSFAPCLTQEFSSSTLIVKVAWQRLHARISFPSFKTDIVSLQRRLGHGDSSWQQADEWVRPTIDEIYTIELRDGSQYGLVGMHVMTKQLREWWWISMWWSPDPNSDFANDKPKQIDILQTQPWSNYQLCTVTDYIEKAQDFPRIGVQPYSWCSNPYLEKGANNAASNCIGCHQHAGTNLSQEQILQDIIVPSPLLLAPHRSDFPTDYVWSVGADIKRLFTK